MTRWQAGALAGCALSLAMAACESDADGSSVRSRPSSDEAADHGPLAVVDDIDGREALIEGELVITDECVFLNGPGSGERVLLVWPSDRVSWNGGTISFESPGSGSHELASGDRVAFGGGGSSEAEDGASFEEWMARIDWVQAPDDQCSSKFRWSIGEWSEPTGNEDPDAGSDAGCEDLDLDVPTPAILTSEGSVELDFLWASSPCGNADGAANFGADLRIIVVDDEARVAVEPQFDVRLAVHVAGTPRGDLQPARRDSDGLIAISPRPAPCSEIRVEMAHDSMKAGYAARLVDAEGDCG